MIRAIAVAALLFASSALAAASAGPQDPAQSPTPSQSSSSSSSSTAAAQPSATTPAKPKPKKVWTNDNVGDAGGAISVVGSSSSGSNKPKSQPKSGAGSTVDPKLLSSLRDQLQRMQSQLDVADRQLSDLKAASKGESRSSTGLNQNTSVYDSSSMEEQIQHLQEKKKRLQAAMDELLDAARKAGIEPGQLR
jgi:hypothetical protein